MPETRAQARKRRCLHSTTSSIDPSQQYRANDPNLPVLYRPLDLEQRQIRILHLLPGHRREPLRCKLHTVLLHDHPSYEALSYAWGNPDDSRSIEVDGNPRHITTNLYNVLRRLRYRRRERQLWVDALCINQSDDVEKSHQVNLMRDIYISTTRGIIWLGDYIDGRKPALAPLNPDFTTDLFQRQTVKTAFAFLKSIAIDDLSPGNHEPMGDDYLKESSEAVEKLLQATWWHRAWTVQEAILPPVATIICGTMQLPFSEVTKGRDISLQHTCRGCCKHLSLRSFWDHMCDLGYLYNKPRGPEAVIDAKIFFRRRHASDARDRVYAYLGLGSETQADYSLEQDDVFKLTTRSLIEEAGTLTALLRTTENNRSLTLPSWVPDWCADFNDDDSFRDLSWIYVFTYFDAVNGTRVKTRVSSSDSVLDVKGVIIDHITAVEHILETWNCAVEMVSRWESTFNCEVYPRGGTYREASWRTIKCDFNMDPDLRNQKSGLRRLTAEDDAEEMATSIAQREGNTFMLIATGMRGFSMTSGLIGIEKQDVQVGDVAAILAGANMPLILRREGRPQEEGKFFKFIGQAYVHGIMDGEAWDSTKNPEWISLI